MTGMEVSMLKLAVCWQGKGRMMLSERSTRIDDMGI